MNDCVTMRELLLTADPAELHGTGDSVIARHIRDCADCADAARRIRLVQARLDEALATLAGGGPRLAVMPQRTTWSPARRRVLRLAASLATAAALILAIRSGDNRPLEPLPGPLAVVPDQPIVNAEGDDPVAVMKTSNPNITVVWVLERERQR